LGRIASTVKPGDAALSFPNRQFEPSGDDVFRKIQPQWIEG
jgi:hypothetical protein